MRKIEQQMNRAIVNKNVNNHEVISESVSEWCVDDITEVNV